MENVKSNTNRKISNKPVKENGKLYKLVFFVMRKGAVFYEDLVLYSFNFCNRREEVYRLINELKNRDLIHITYIEYKKGTKRKTDRVIRVTEKGFTMIGMTLPIDDVKVLLDVLKRTKNLKNKREARLLELNHIKTFFNCAKVYTESFNKPSLEEVISIYKNYMKPELTDDEQTVKAKIEGGIYYTDIEIKEYIKKYYKRNNGEPVASSFKGVCVKGHNIIVVYSSPKKNTARMVSTHSPLIESKLVDCLKFIFMTSTVSALLLGNQPSFIYSTAEGRRYGKHNDSTRNTLYPIIYPDNETISAIFRYLYALDINNNCVKYLSNILNRDSLFDELYRTVNRDMSGKYVKEGKDLRYINDKGIKELCVFMPYYELKELKEIRDSKYTPVILCNKEQIGIIQHIVHKEPKYIDYVSLKEINVDLPIYDKQGNIKGVKIFYDYLKEQNLATSKKEVNSLPDKYNMTYNAFFNAIAGGKVDLNEAIGNIRTHNKPEMSIYRKRQKTILVRSELYDALKEYAKLNNKTLKWATNHLVLKK